MVSAKNLPLYLLAILSVRNSGSGRARADVVDDNDGDVVDTIDYVDGSDNDRGEDMLNGMVVGNEDGDSDSGDGLSNGFDEDIDGDNNGEENSGAGGASNNPLDGPTEPATAEESDTEEDGSAAPNSEAHHMSPERPIEEEEAVPAEGNAATGGPSNESIEEEDEEEDEDDDGESLDLQATTDSSGNNRQISIPIAPPIALIFDCANDDDDDDDASSDTIVSPCNVGYAGSLLLLETAANEYAQRGKQFRAALKDIADEIEGLEYGGFELEYSLPALRRRTLTLLSSETEEEGPHASYRMDNPTIEWNDDAIEAVPTRGSYVRRRRRTSSGEVNGRSVVLLSGTANFMASSAFSTVDDYQSLSSASASEYLSQALLEVFAPEDDADNHGEKFIETFQRMAEQKGGRVGSGWLTRVVRYRTDLETNLVYYDSEQLRGGVPAASVKNDSGNTNNSSGGSSSNNLLLIVGAAGAAFSLVVLVAGLCYAKKSYNKNNGNGDGNASKKKKQQKVSIDETNVVFEPGKNNPRSPNATSSSKSIFKKSSRDIVAPPPIPLNNEDASNNHHDNDNEDDDDDDGESHADFLLARAALEHSKHKGDEGSAADNTFGEDMSYAFTVEGESLAPFGDKSSAAGGMIASNNMHEDAMIGAGGLASFANDKGVFRWNEDGTKMVYTPNLQRSDDSGEQNGFVFDEAKKKWVVKDQVVGEKNVSFKPSPEKREGGGGGGGIGGGGHLSIVRTRSSDSIGTGISGLSGFSYGDIALDKKRSRSTGTERSYGGGDSVSMGTLTPITPQTPQSPSTPQDQGVEVPLPSGLIRSDSGSESEFAPNTNVEKFLSGGGDDDFTMFSGMSSEFSTTNAFHNNNNAPSNNGGAMSMPRAVTPERVSSQRSQETDAATFVTFGTGDPGRIVPKKRPDAPPNKMKIAEDAPFDEESIPFDERSRISRKSSSQTKRIGSGLVLPSVLDNLEDDESASDRSEESSNSAQVLQDLDKLSRFMMERKRSSKGNNQLSSSGSSRRRRKGSGLVNGGGSFGRSKYSDPNRGV